MLGDHKAGTGRASRWLHPAVPTGQRAAMGTGSGQVGIWHRLDPKPLQFPEEEGKNRSRNVDCISFSPPDTAGSPREFYCRRSVD
jgi:hypothetical protein